MINQNTIRYDKGIWLFVRSQSKTIGGRNLGFRVLDSNNGRSHVFAQALL